MDHEEFQRYAETHQALADYLDDVAQTSQDEASGRAVGLEMLFVTASYALYLWVRTYLERRRGLDEADLRRAMLADIELLVARGYSHQEAQKTVLAVSKAVATKPPSDSVLTAALKALSGTNQTGQ
jgi:hypothetical protein